MAMKLSQQEIQRSLYVSLQSFAGLMPAGLFYGWGVMVESINVTFNPSNPGVFGNNHGIFSGIVLLFLSTAMVGPVKFAIDRKIATEFTLQLSGLFFTVLGFVMAGISTQFKLLWLLYVGAAVPLGMGAALVYQRLVFSHQLWFKSINIANLGSGSFGFSIGVWTVIFYIIFEPLRERLELCQIFYVYASFCVPFLLFPIFTIDDKSTLALESSKRAHSPSESTRAPQGSFISSPCDTDDDIGTPTKGQVLGEQNSEVVGLELPVCGGRKTLCDEGQLEDVKQYIAIDLDTGEDQAKLSELNCLDEQYFALCEEHQVDVDEFGHCELSYQEILFAHRTWFIIIFYVLVLTPGWGIKIAAFQILQVLFRVTPTLAAEIAAFYVSCYAIGRLCSGILAEVIGTVRSYDVIIMVTAALLLALPATATSLRHDSADSPGCMAFTICICIIGLMYGGAVALLYSIAFDIFGKRNYRSVFTVTILGFAFAILVGSLSSSYSFAASSSPEETIVLATRWFYAMAGSCILGLFVLHLLSPMDYTSIVRGRVEAAMTKKNKNNNVQIGTDGDMCNRDPPTA